MSFNSPLVATERCVVSARAAARPVTSASPHRLGCPSVGDERGPTTTAIAECGDAGGRPRELNLTLRPPSRVVIAIPPGELATLTPVQAQHVDRVLRDMIRDPMTLQLAEPTPLGTAIRLRCRDGFDRARALMLLPGIHGPLTLAAPAGGVAVLALPEIRRLRSAVHRHAWLTWAPSV